MMWRVFLIGVSLLFGLGCGDWSRSLPNGWSLVRVNGAEILIVGPDPDRQVIISSNVDRFGTEGDLVFGHVSVPDLPPDSTRDSIPGYFLVNTRTGAVLRGLDEEAWHAALRDAGVTRNPELRRPSRFS